MGLSVYLGLPDVDVDRVGEHVRAAGVGRYQQPDDALAAVEAESVVGGLGRAAVADISIQALEDHVRLAREAGSSGVHIAVFDAPGRSVFVPHRFSRSPIPWDEGVLGSAALLLDELAAMAPELGIVLDGKALPDEEAAAIASAEPLDEDDDELMLHDLRPTWLALFEAARLSTTHHVAFEVS